MEFKVKFDGHECCEALWRSERRPLGLQGVNQIREEVGVANLPLERINGYIRSTTGPEVTVSIDEPTARMLERYFTYTHRLTVYTPKEFLNRFIVTRVYTSRDSHTGEIFEAGLEDVLDTDALVRAWLDAGAPKEWRPMGAPEAQEAAEK